MHVKHADNSEMNELSAHVIGCTLPLLDAPRAGARVSMTMRWQMIDDVLRSNCRLSKHSTTRIECNAPI